MMVLLLRKFILDFTLERCFRLNFASREAPSEFEAFRQLLPGSKYDNAHLKQKEYPSFEHEYKNIFNNRAVYYGMPGY